MNIIYVSTYSSFCRYLISALDAFQEVLRYGFKLPFHADDDAKGFRLSISSVAKRGQNRHGHPAQHQVQMLCGIRRCCETTYENGGIVFYATRSFRMCTFQIFALESVRLRMLKKSLTLN